MADLYYPEDLELSDSDDELKTGESFLPPRAKRVKPGDRKPAAKIVAKDDDDSDSHNQGGPHDDQWEAERKHRKDQEYNALIQAKMDPTPKGRYHIVLNKQNMDIIRPLLKANAQDDVALRVGVDDRPIYIIFQHRRGLNYVPCIPLLNMGDLNGEQLNRLNFSDDPFQSDKPRRATPQTPVISEAKALLSFRDLEFLRSKGGFFLRRAKELANQGGYFKPEVYTMEVPGSATDGKEGTSLLHILQDKDGLTVFQIARAAKATVGAPAVGPNYNAKLVSLRLEEFKNLRGWISEIYREGQRLAATRVPVNACLTPELEATLEGHLVQLLTEKLCDHGAPDLGGDPMVVFDKVSALVRGTSTITLKKELGAKCSKDVFQPYHLSICLPGRFGSLVDKVRHSIAATLKAEQ